MSGAVRAVCGATVAAGLLVCAAWGAGAEPPALNPFGAAGETVRDDAVPGYLELSDGTIRVGQIYLTRDAKLKVFDDAQKRQREVPLSVIQRVDCRVDREWLEKEWRFKENANDEKVYTGRNYPAREYLHTITLQDGRALKGPLSALVYVSPEGGGEVEKYLLHKRDKGALDVPLNKLTYVRSIRLGDEAQAEGRRRATAANGKSSGSDKGARRVAAPKAKARD